jgi:aspartate aminotransferase
LLDEAYVAVVQGAAFAMSPHVRISTATSQPVLKEACARIAAFCAGLK